MTAAVLNLVLNPGITFGPIVFTFKDSDGAPINLTDYNVWAWVKVTPDDLPASVPLLDLTATISDAANGKVRIYISDEDTFALEEMSGYWDIILENTDGERIGPFVAGTFKIENIITKPYET